MITKAQSQLKHSAFWLKMERASEKAQDWPRWMKGSPENKRDTVERTIHAQAVTTKTNRNRAK